MTVKAVFVVQDLVEESNGQVRANAKVIVLNGAGTGGSYDQDFNFDPAAPNVNSQIQASVKAYLESSHGVSFGATDVLLMVPAIL